LFYKYVTYLLNIKFLDNTKELIFYEDPQTMKTMQINVFPYISKRGIHLEILICFFLTVEKKGNLVSYVKEDEVWPRTVRIKPVKTPD